VFQSQLKATPKTGERFPVSLTFSEIDRYAEEIPAHQPEDINMDHSSSSEDELDQETLQALIE